MARSRRRTPKARFWIISILLLLCIFSVLSNMEKNILRDREDSINLLTQEIREWEVKVADARRKFDFANTDKFAERLARTELGYIMPGEILYVTKTDNSSD